MFWGSQDEDLEHSSHGHDEDLEQSKGTGKRKLDEGSKSLRNLDSQNSNDEDHKSASEELNSHGSKRERRDSKGRLLPNPVLCCESLSMRATAQVNSMNSINEFILTR